MLVLKGIHGTTRSAAQKIVQSQTFQTTPIGRVGTGVYFWRESLYAKDLALCWYEYRVRKGDYPAHEGVILTVDLGVNENELLDLEHPSYKDALSLFAKTRPSELSPADDAGELGILYNLFIGELETTAQQKYKVCQVRLPSPPKCLTYPTFLLGNPLAYVVRDPTGIHLVNLEDS
jgi:hypothetical protein